MAETHLWFNGYDHGAGATEAEASAYLQRVCGLDADEAEGEGWCVVPDDAPILDEDGKPLDPPETALEMAEAMLAGEISRACLIAAAPELLEACRAVRDGISALLPFSLERAGVQADLALRLGAAHGLVLAAIAKAEGSA